MFVNYKCFTQSQSYDQHYSLIKKEEEECPDLVLRYSINGENENIY